MLGWYAASVHHHKCGARELGKQGLTVFDPVVRTDRFLRGKKRTTERAYIPGYLFVQFDVDEQAWKFINSTFGIKKLISAGEMPLRISDDAMDVLLDRCVGSVNEETGLISYYVSDPDVLDIELERIAKGDFVTVNDGAFAGLTGTATRKQLGDKVWLALTIFNRESQVMVNRKSVQIAQRAPGPN